MNARRPRCLTVIDVYMDCINKFLRDCKLHWSELLGVCLIETCRRPAAFFFPRVPCLIQQRSLSALTPSTSLPFVPQTYHQPVYFPSQINLTESN